MTLTIELNKKNCIKNLKKEMILIFHMVKKKNDEKCNVNINKMKNYIQIIYKIHIHDQILHLFLFIKK